MNFIFFFIYKRFYKDLETPLYDNTKDIAEHTVIIIVGGIIAWIILIDEVLTFMFFHKVSLSINTIFYFIIAFILFVYLKRSLVLNKKYIAIYENYKKDYSIKSYSLITFLLFVAFPVIMFLLLAIVLPRS